MVDLTTRISKLEQDVWGEMLYIRQNDGTTAKMPGKAVLDLLVDLIKSCATGKHEKPNNCNFDIVLNAEPGQPAPVDLLRRMAQEIMERGSHEH